MNIALTYKCNEGCSHCFENALPEGSEMTKTTLNNTVKFLKKVNPAVIEISGGEFTLHSDFGYFISYISHSLPDTKIIMLSNGSFITDGDKRAMIIQLLRKKNVFGLQIVTDKRYYPNYEATMKNKRTFEFLGSNVFVCEGVAQLVNLGRARDNNLEIATEKSPMRSNIRLLSRHESVNSFATLISTLQKAQKFCCPHIDPSGNLHLGETRYCKIFGSVNDNLGVLFKNIKSDIDFCGICGHKLNFGNLKNINL